MKRFLVRIPWHAELLVEVSAKSEKDALSKALENAHTSLCWQCSSNVELGEHNDKCEMFVEEIGE